MKNALIALSLLSLTGCVTDEDLTSFPPQEWNDVDVALIEPSAQVAVVERVWTDWNVEKNAEISVVVTNGINPCEYLTAFYTLEQEHLAPGGLEEQWELEEDEVSRCELRKQIARETLALLPEPDWADFRKLEFGMDYAAGEFDALASARWENPDGALDGDLHSLEMGAFEWLDEPCSADVDSLLRQMFSHEPFDANFVELEQLADPYWEVEMEGVRPHATSNVGTVSGIVSSCSFELDW